MKTYEESLAISREIGDRSAVALILNNVAIVHRVRGDFAEAKKNYLESLAIRRAIGEKAGVAATLNNLANIMSDEGDLSGAKKVYEETLKHVGGDRRQTRDRAGLVQHGRDGAPAGEPARITNAARPGPRASPVARGQERRRPHARQHRHGADGAGASARGEEVV